MLWHDTLAICLTCCVNSDALDKFVKSWCFFTVKTTFQEMKSELGSAVSFSISKVTTLCSVDTSLIDVLNKLPYAGGIYACPTFI